MTRPVPMQWDGEAMQPTKGFAALADKEFVVGEVYTLVEADQERSGASHRHYFASVYEAWLNLPPLDAERFPTADHLRKYALIRAGYCDSRELPCSSKAEAVRVAAFMKPMDTYSLVTVTANVVRVYTAKSQKARAMSRKVFQESKDAVLDVLAGMIEVPTERLLFAGQGGSEAKNLRAEAA